MSSHNLISIAGLHIGTLPGLSRANEIVLSEVFEVFVIWTHLQALTLGTVLLLLEQLESVGGGMLVYVVGLSAVDESCVIWRRLLPRKHGNGQVFSDVPGNIGVLMLWCCSLGVVGVVVESVTSVEEFAHVSANVVVDKECTTWMILAIPRNIKDKVVKDNKLVAIFDLLFELGLRHDLAVEFLLKFDVQLGGISLHSEIHFAAREKNDGHWEINWCKIGCGLILPLLIVIQKEAGEKLYERGKDQGGRDDLVELADEVDEFSVPGEGLAGNH